MFDDQKSDELLHYGVLGMKWGKRRRNTLAERANRAHDEADKVHGVVNPFLKPMESKTRKRVATAKKTGKATDKDRAFRAKREERIVRNLSRILTAPYDYKAIRRDRAVKKVDQYLSEVYDMKTPKKKGKYWKYIE